LRSGDWAVVVVSWVAMVKPSGHDDETRDPADPSAAIGGDDPDRAAILARRQRFIALALSGLATTAACEKPKEDPAAPKADKGAQQGKGDQGARPHPCLEVAAPPEPEGGSSTGRPMPCLDVAPPEPEPDDGGRPSACLKIAAPPPEPKPHPCLSIKPPAPEPKPQPCLKVRQPEPEPEPKAQPCLRVAKPKGA
jgi:hypothetical protein